MNKYLVTSYRWVGGDVRERRKQEDLVSADTFDVEGYSNGPIALFHTDTGELVGAYTNFESVVLVSE